MRKLIVAGIIGVLSGLLPVRAGDALKAHPDSTAWQNLFATDLSDAFYPAGVWSWTEGELSPKGKDEAVWTKNEYENFILDLEFKLEPAANSGVFIYNTDMKNWIPNTVEIQLLDDGAAKWAKAPANWKCGGVFGHSVPMKAVVKKPGEWNRMTIRCQGPMISVLLNGELITDVNLKDWKSGTKNPDGSAIPPWMPRPFAELATKGRIGLQGAHGGIPTHFRNLKIKPLDAVSVSTGAIPACCRTGGIALGCQAYTFRSFTLMDAIDETAAVGGKVIELYPGQKFSAETGDLKFDHNATEATLALLKAQLQKAGVRAVNYGVVTIPKNEADARKIFEFAKKLNLYGITTESVDALDTIEKLVKEYDIHIGIHNHPRRPKDPSYRVWDPNYVLSVVKDRDARIGACADVGHWVRSGLNPVDSLKILHGRVMSVHLKDLNAKAPDAHDVPYGTGISDVPAMLAELNRQHFAGNASIEYEYNTKELSEHVAQCVGFVRGLGVK